MFIQSHFITIFLRKAAVISLAKGFKRFITIPSFYITKQNFETIFACILAGFLTKLQPFVTSHFDVTDFSSPKIRATNFVHRRSFRQNSTDLLIHLIIYFNNTVIYSSQIRIFVCSVLYTGSDFILVKTVLQMK